MFMPKDLESQIIRYLSKKSCLHRYLEVAKDCARDIIDMRFADIISGEVELPSTEELKSKAAQKVEYDFNPRDFIEQSPIDLSGFGEEDIKRIVEKIEEIYKRFHEAQAMAVARATRRMLQDLVESIRSEMDGLKKKYLS